MTMVLWLALGCGTDGVLDNPDVQGGDDSGLEAGDTVPPVIEFVPVEDNQLSGDDVEMVATITDDGAGVFIATLYFRNETDSSKDWKQIGFLRQGESDDWVAKIAADEQHSSGMWYYLEAVDRSGNTSVDPSQGGDQPYHFGYTD